LFVPDHAFESLAQRQIKWLREPALQCAESVHSELLKIITDIEHKDLTRFTNLHDAIVDIAIDILRDRLTQTNAMINQTLEIELSYINTSHPDFIGFNLKGIPEVTNQKHANFDDFEDNTTKSSGGIFGYLFGGPAKPKPKTEGSFDSNELSEREKGQITMIRQLLESYIGISKKNIQDRVTKIIVMVLIKGSIKDLKRELVKRLYQGENYDYKHLLSEADDIEMKRRICREELTTLEKADAILSSTETL